MRLIDADELIKDRVSNDPVVIAALCEPTIDAVPVVRCKDCKYWEADGTYEFDIDGIKRTYGVCSHTLHHCKDNHFCSYGKKMDEEEG